VGTGAGHTSLPEGSSARLEGHIKGFSRGSQPERSTLSLGLERTAHSVADLFTFQLQRPPGNEQTWLDRINAALQAKCLEDNSGLQMEVLTCKVVPGKGSELTGYNSCSQRRLECLLPLSLVLPPSEGAHAQCASHLVATGKEFQPSKTVSIIHLYFLISLVSLTEYILNIVCVF